jgi:hypothetical protein
MHRSECNTDEESYAVDSAKPAVSLICGELALKIEGFWMR